MWRKTSRDLLSSSSSFVITLSVIFTKFLSFLDPETSSG
jgi:hypothetical protein